MTAAAPLARHALRADARRAAARTRAGSDKGFLSYLSTSISAAVLLLVLGLATVTIALPALVGGRPLTILTQSMEPTLPPGTLLVITPTAAGDVRVGDVLTYQIRSGEPDVVSHRVISRLANSDGSITFITKGDNNGDPDPEPVQEVQVVGTLWYSVPLLGWVNNVFTGDLRAKIVPILVGGLFLYSAVQVVSALRSRRKGSAAGPS